MSPSLDARTRQGLRLAAVAESHDIALSLGVSVRWAIAVAWILGTVVATCAAIVLLSGRIISLDVAQIGFKALPVALLGGLESIRGALLAGIIIGVGEVFAMSYLDPIANVVTTGQTQLAEGTLVVVRKPVSDEVVEGTSAK